MFEPVIRRILSLKVLLNNAQRLIVGASASKEWPKVRKMTLENIVWSAW